MIIEQIWTANSLRNFNYLVACPDSGEALAIDPLDFRQCLAVASSHGWRITQIVNTHEHADHIGGNKALAAATGADIIAHHAARTRVADMARGVGAGDRIKIGRA
ncbi:MAG: MBL fold metallo-hydrolase, partial [Woeseia sp.]